MNDVQLTTDPRVTQHFAAYPDVVRSQMRSLRQLVLDTATQVPEIQKMEECLKWGEPSYKTPIGSTLRMDWKPKNPERYALYFQCSSRLVETFRGLFGSRLEFEGNRAILFPINKSIPTEMVKACIKATLTYHTVKHLPTLGI